MGTSKRRQFIKKISIGGLVLSGMRKKNHNPIILNSDQLSIENNLFDTNDQIQLAIIGCGIQGQINARTASKVNGVKVVAACDLYEGRLKKMNEDYGSIFTTRDYKKILERSDVDAVCIATSDHWHDHITISALEAGKAVYCEKPMVHHLKEGHAVIKSEKKSRQPLIIGSQRVSSIIVEKAKELYQSGTIGDLIMADITYDRSSAVGAWQYSVPTDASAEAVMWNEYLGDAPKVNYDENRFFRWRNYKDYGTGVAGDLFVHLFSTLHVITGSIGPEKIYATGGLRYWKDGRDVPDVTLGLYDYGAQSSHPAFNVQMRVNFADGSGGGSRARLIGTEGVMTVGGRSIQIEKAGLDDQPRYKGYDSFMTFSKTQKGLFKKWYEDHYKSDQRAKVIEPKKLEYLAPEGYSDHLDHWKNFAKAIRKSSKIVENGTFGLRAAGPSLATNESYFNNKIINWDAGRMKIV
ncbi:MAG: Gfo/Idh/MocA family oxidoreductase [Saprospiraceae bacterium]